MSDKTLRVSRVSGDAPYYLVSDPNGGTGAPSVKKDKKLRWTPENGGNYGGGTFALLGVGRYDGGAFDLDDIDVDGSDITAKAKKATGSGGMRYLLFVLEEPSDGGAAKVYMAYGGTPVEPMAGEERPKPPPEVIIDP